MKDIFGALWQTAWTWWRWRKARCLCSPQKNTLETTVTDRGYVLRCRQCGNEYVEKYGSRFEQVWPKP